MKNLIEKTDAINVSKVIKALSITGIFKDAKQSLMKENNMSANKGVKA